ncbi:MAG: polysaccharide deacetylase family protein [Actinomycetaceae bacterium]|nr:polysaccharide deacetylase family protein [Actinomycetaceae bacterium]
MTRTCGRGSRDGDAGGLLRPRADEVIPPADAHLTRRQVLQVGSLAAGASTTAALLGACTSSSVSSAPTTPAATATATATPTVQTTATPSPTTPTSVAFNPAALQALEEKFAGRTPSAWGLDIAGIMQRTDSSAVALTLDACGGDGGNAVDMRLLDFLRERSIRATLFLNQRWIHANEQLAIQLTSDPLFELGNHGTKHCPLSVVGRDAYGIAGTASVKEAILEVAHNHRTLFELTGKEPRWFRSGTAHYDDVGVQICLELGETPVGFSVNADGGATFPAADVAEATLQADAGAILIAHFNQPDGETAPGLELALPQLLDAGFRFDFLS